MKKILLSLAALFSLTMHAEIKTKTVDYKHGDVSLQGYLAYDDSVKGARPAVLLIPEWWGLTDNLKNKAREVATMGYTAFAVDMYGNGKITTDAKEAAQLAGQFYGKPLMAERAKAGLDALLASGLADSKKIAVIGFCFGGATAQVLAYSGAPVVGVVSFHGTPIPAPAGTHITAKFLLQQGAIDPFIKPEEVSAFEDAANKAGLDWQFIFYSGTVHSFTNPEADSYHLPGACYNASSHHRSWALMGTFFKEVLK